MLAAPGLHGRAGAALRRHQCSCIEFRLSQAFEFHLVDSQLELSPGSRPSCHTIWKRRRSAVATLLFENLGKIEPGTWKAINRPSQVLWRGRLPVQLSMTL